MYHPIRHFITITRHRHKVMWYCFKAGIGFQGLFHDLSKYSFVEFMNGAKYYTGTCSPNALERAKKGYSLAWMHHKGRNKHHYEYWLDYSTKNIPGGMAPAPMPNRYIVEMLMDRIAASKVYKKEAYTNRSPLEYYLSAKEPAPLHKKTKKVLEKLLYMLAEEEIGRAHV